MQANKGAAGCRRNGKKREKTTQAKSDTSLVPLSVCCNNLSLNALVPPRGESRPLTCLAQNPFLPSSLATQRARGRCGNASLVPRAGIFERLAHVPSFAKWSRDGLHLRLAGQKTV